MFGHGRALEAYLVLVKIWYGIQLIAPVQIRVIVLEDVWWYIPDSYVGAMFLSIGTAQLIGLILNLRGRESSWAWRFFGANAAIFLWAWLIAKSMLIGAYGTGALPFWGSSFVASIFLMAKGWNRLPVPGAPGAP